MRKTSVRAISTCKGVIFLLCISLLFPQMSSSAAAASTALDAFHQLISSSGESTQDPVPDDSAFALSVLSCYLAASAASPDASGEATTPAQKAPLTEHPQESLLALGRLTDADLVRFASSKELPTAYVRSCYYKALADLLQKVLTDPSMQPETSRRYQNLETILTLFLMDPDPAQDDPETASAREEIRSGMTIQASAQLAETFSLPTAFLEYMIMEENWHSSDWTEARDWAQIRAQLSAQSADSRSNSTNLSFPEQSVGSRDALADGPIHQMQEALIRLGYLRGSADGIFGPRTQAALIEYQLANGLHPSGSFRGSDALSLRSPEAVARTAYDDDFWDEDHYAPEHGFSYFRYLDDLYGHSGPDVTYDDDGFDDDGFDDDGFDDDGFDDDDFDDDNFDDDDFDDDNFDDDDDDHDDDDDDHDDDDDDD